MFFVFVRFFCATYWQSYSGCRYVRRNRCSLLICFVFKNYIMGHLPASMRGLDDVEESNFFMVAPLAAAVAAPPPIVPVGWFDIILIYLYLDYEVVVVEFL